MALTTIDAAKESAEAYLPVLLAEVDFYGASAPIWRAATMPLSAAAGTAQYAGHDWEGRISQDDLGQVQSLAAEGVDSIPNAKLTLADADGHVYTTYEQPWGFEGATLTLTFVLFDPETNTFSSDAYLIFKGRCEQPECNDLAVIVNAVPLLNLQSAMAPPTPIQQTCPNWFPATLQDRTDGGNNTGRFRFCGYCPDHPNGALRRGNLNGGSPFPDCDKTKGNCIQRGMYVTDIGGHQTGRFSAVQWDPPKSIRSREYTSGNWLTIENNSNAAKYGEFQPVVFGTGPVSLLDLNVQGDGNSTRGEAMISTFRVNQIIQVRVNDEILQAANGMNHESYQVSDPLMAWYLVNNGQRDGAPNALPGFGGQGDPYGSMAVIAWVVLKPVAAANSTPNVEADVQGVWIRVYSSPSAYTEVFSNNAVWIRLAMFGLMEIDYANIDIQSFIDDAAYADSAVSYIDNNGSAGTHARYQLFIPIRQRRSLADLLTGTGRSCLSQITWSNATGQIQHFTRKTLAEQQPAPIAGSNYNTGVGSLLANGSAGTGYVAYRFTPSSIIRNSDGSSSLRRLPRAIANKPNRLQFNFVNLTPQGYSQDSITIVDQAAIQRDGQENPTTIQIDGIPNVDQGKRVGTTLNAESNLGNLRGDASGTETWEWQTTYKFVRGKVGQIVMVDYARFGLTNQLMRVVGIAPGSNFAMCTVSAAIHADAWYVDAFGQGAEAPATPQRRQPLSSSPALPWAPFAVAAAAGDPLFDPTEYTFSLQQTYLTAADGTRTAYLVIRGKTPVNVFSSITPPTLDKQATIGGGGSLVGLQSYYLAVCAYDPSGNGQLAPPSSIVEALIPTAGSAFSASAHAFQWPSGTTQFALFAGKNPNRLSWQGDISGTPATLTLTSLQTANWGLPDPRFDHLAPEVFQIAHSGILGGLVNAVGTGTITLTGSGTGVSYAGYDVSILGKADGTALPILDYRVVSNTADVLTVTPDPSAVGGVAVGDVIVIRSKPTISGKTVSDTLWANPFDGGTGMIPGQEVGRLLLWISGPDRGHMYPIASNNATSVTIGQDWLTTPTASDRYIILYATAEAVAKSQSLRNSNPLQDTSITFSVDNHQDQAILVRVNAEDDQNRAQSYYSPFREIWIFGKGQNFIAVAANYTETVNDTNIEVDTTSGNKTLQLLPAASVRVKQLLIEKTSSDSHTLTILPAGAETIAGRANIVITAQYKPVVLRSNGGAAGLPAWSIISSTGSDTAITLTITAGHATPDATARFNYLTLPHGTTTTINAPTGDNGPGSNFWLILLQDGIGGGLVTLPWIAPVPGSPGTPGYVDMREIDIRPNVATRIFLSKPTDDISWMYFAQTDSL